MSLKDKSFFLSFLIANFAMVASWAWYLANRGSKYWQENWERIIDDIEMDLNIKIFGDVKDIKPESIFHAKKYSLSRLAIALSFFTSFCWFVINCWLLFEKIFWKFSNNFITFKIFYIDVFYILIFLFSISFIIILSLKCKS